MTPFPCFVEKHGRGFFHLPKQGLCLQPKPTGRQAALYLLYIGAQSQPYLRFPPLLSFPAFIQDCAICLLYQTYPASPTRNNQRKPVLAHVCPLVRPTQGGQIGWHTGTSALLKQPRMPAHCQQASSFVCPAGDCLTHPKPEYCYSPVLSTNPFIQRSTFYTGLMPLYFLSQLRVISLQN